MCSLDSAPQQASPGEEVVLSGTATSDCLIPRAVSASAVARTENSKRDSWLWGFVRDDTQLAQCYEKYP